MNVFFSFECLEVLNKEKKLTVIAIAVILTIEKAKELILLMDGCFSICRSQPSLCKFSASITVISSWFRAVLLLLVFC